MSGNHSEGAKGVLLGDYANSADGVMQGFLVPNWTETLAIYVDWYMFSTDNYGGSHDALLFGFSENAQVIYNGSIWNTDPQNAWYFSKATLYNAARYRGHVLVASVWGFNDALYPTGWFVDNVRVYAACGSWIASTAEGEAKEWLADPEIPSRFLP